MDSDILPKVKGSKQTALIYINEDSKEEHKDNLNSNASKLYITLK